LAPPTLSIHASAAQLKKEIIQKEETPVPAATGADTTTATPPPASSITADEARIEGDNLRNMRTLLHALLKSSEYIEYARTLQARLESLGTSHEPLRYEICLSLRDIKNTLENRAFTFIDSTQETVAGETGMVDYIFGSRDDIHAVLANIIGYRLKPEDHVFDEITPFQHLAEWNTLILNAIQWTGTGSAPRTEPRLSARRRGRDERGRRVAVATEYALAPSVARLFVRGHGDSADIDANDIGQGELSDCYFMASIAAVAETHPEAIRNLIHDNGDGTYNVTLYVNGDRLNPANPRVITVTPDMPVGADGRLQYGRTGRSADEVELWVLLIEKAYAQLRGGYGALDTGGTVREGMFALTGRRTNEYQIRNLSEERLIEIISEAKLNAWPITAGTSAASDASRRTREMRNREEYQILNWHMYRISNIHTEGETTLDLMNPWGRANVYRMPIPDFKIAFTHMSVLRDYDGTAPTRRTTR
jgi:hypothetical protein